MPVNTTTRKRLYACNGSQVIFPFTFPISAEGDLVVKVRTDATGAVTTLVLTTNYTVTKAGANWDSGGNVTTVSTYASGKTLLVKRVTQQTQTRDYIESDDFPAESHEEGLDKLTRISQELQEELGRSLHITDTDLDTLDMTIPNSVDRASKWLGFDASGQPTAVQTTPSSVTVTAAAKTVLDDATVAAMCDTLGALDVNNDDLDDVPEGTTYNRVLAASQDGSGRINQIEGDTAFRSAQTGYCAVGLVGAFDLGVAIATRGRDVYLDGAGKAYLAVNLPHGATVTSLKSHCTISENNLVITLYRDDLDGSNILALAANTHSGTGSVEDTSIDYAAIDNSAYKYYIEINKAVHTATGNTCHSIIITYTITEPKP